MSQRMFYFPLTPIRVKGGDGTPFIVFCHPIIKCGLVMQPQKCAGERSAVLLNGCSPTFPFGKQVSDAGNSEGGGNGTVTLDEPDDRQEYGRKDDHLQYNGRYTFPRRRWGRRFLLPFIRVRFFLWRLLPVAHGSSVDRASSGYKNHLHPIGAVRILEKCSHEEDIGKRWIDREMTMGDIIRLEDKESPKPPSGTLLNGEHFPILAGMAPVLLHLLNQSATLMHVSDGVEILQQGDIPQDIYFVVDGMVGIVKKSDGKRKELRRLGIGEVFGELGALRDRNRVASVYTLSQSRIIRVQADTVRQLMEIDPDFRERLNLLMNRRIIETFLASHPVFAGLSEEALLSLAETLQLRIVPEGGKIFSAGDVLHGVYLIVAGEVGISLDLPDGGTVLFEMRRDNELLGELPDELSTSAAYSAIASCESDVLHFDDAVIELLRTQSPKVAKRLDDFIARRARATQVRLDLHRP